MDMVIWE